MPRRKFTEPANNCVVLKEFNVPGGTYQPGRELCLAEILLEKWEQSGFVERLEVVKPTRRKRTVKAKTAVMA